MKGETVAEIAGSARAMRAAATAIHPQVDGPLLDTAGTGGDGAHSINISTTAAFVIAGAGYAVAKHGNRAASSQCGSADVLEALGVNLALTPQQVQACIEQIGIGFMFAPHFHPAMKHAIGPRRELAQRTIFNILGPLTNPAGASAQVMGVYQEGLTEVLARVLNELGSRRAFVVHGLDGLDEISVSGESKISEVRGGRVYTYRVSPEDFGLRQSRLSDLQGGNAADNAQIITSLLNGEEGPRRDVVLMNASLAIAAGGKANDFHEGVKLAAQSIDSGAAMEKLRRLVEFSRRHSAH
jgi:anthranilate phosphoribosyltransferase